MSDLFEDYALGLRLFTCPREKKVAQVDLLYPGVAEGHVEVLEISLEHVRAADSIRVSYDFARDGWSVKQASTFSWNTQEEADAPNAEDWQEVAFVQAWGREREEVEEK